MTNSSGSVIRFDKACSGLSVVVCLLLVILSSGVGVAFGAEEISAQQEQELILHWREQRDASLRREGGWLALVGLDWLQAGANRIGAAADNDIQIPGGPDYWGTIHLVDNSLRFERADNPLVLVNEATPDVVDLVADIAGAPTVVESGSVGFYVIFRESYLLRVYDKQASARLNFKGIDSYPVQLDWRIQGQLKPAEPGRTVKISNVLGQISENPVYGVFQFEQAGENFELLALGDDTSSSLWFIFADRTNGHGSYGAGRFLYSEGMPVNGALVVDFNKAYNPPCAFNEFATCPLPPQENRLNLAVTAGEKDAHHASQ